MSLFQHKNRKASTSKEILSKDQIEDIAGMLAKNPADSRNLQAQLTFAPKVKQSAIKTAWTLKRRAERLIEAEQRTTEGRRP